MTYSWRSTWQAFVVLFTLSAPIGAQQTIDGWVGHWRFAALNYPDTEEFRQYRMACNAKLWTEAYLNLERDSLEGLSGTFIEVQRVAVMSHTRQTTAAEFVQKCSLPGAKYPLDGAQVRSWLVRGKAAIDGQSAQLDLHSGKCESQNDWCEGSSFLGFIGRAGDRKMMMTRQQEGLVEEWKSNTGTTLDLYVRAPTLEARVAAIEPEVARIVRLFSERDFSGLHRSMRIPSGATPQQMTDYWRAFFAMRGTAIRQSAVIEKLISTDVSDKPWWGAFTIDVTTDREPGRLYVLLQGKNSADVQVVAMIWR